MLVLGAVAAAACGPPPEPAPPPRPEPAEAPPVVAYAEAPHRELARRATDAALAVMRGEAVAPGTLALRGEGPRVDAAGERPAPPLEPLAFLARLDVQLRAGQSAEPGAAWLKLGLWLDGEALRVVQLERRDVPGSEVPAPDGLERAARSVGARLAAGELTVETPQLSGVHPPPPPQGPALERLEALAAEHAVGAVRVDDVAVLARDAAGTTWLLQMRIVAAEGGRPLFDGAPLVRPVAAVPWGP